MNHTKHGPSNAGVSNSKCSEGQIRTYKITCGPHYDNLRNALWWWRNKSRTSTLQETAFMSYFLRKVWWVIDKPFLAVSTIV